MLNKIVTMSKKKKIKRLSSNRYYATAFISNPCDQLFGPPLNCSLANSSCETTAKEKSFNVSMTNFDYTCITNSSMNADNNNLEDSKLSLDAKILNEVENILADNVSSAIIDRSSDKFDYIPTPKWNKSQNCILEELFKKSRYPKSAELKVLAQSLNVMDTDVEVGVLGATQMCFLPGLDFILYFCRNGSGKGEAGTGRRGAKMKPSKASSTTTWTSSSTKRNYIFFYSFVLY